MKFPKAVMSVSEMTKMGFTRAFLRSMLDKHGADFAWRTDGGGKWMIDTEAFGRFLNGRREGADMRTRQPVPARTPRRRTRTQCMASTCKEIMAI